MYVEYPLHTGLRYSETCRQRFVLKFVFNIQRLLFPQMRCGSGAGRIHKSNQEASGRGGPARGKQTAQVYVLRRPVYSAEEGTLFEETYAGSSAE